MATGFKGLNDLGKVLAAQEKSIVQSAQKRASEERQADGNTPQTQLEARGTGSAAVSAGAATSRGLGNKPGVRVQKRVAYEEDEPWAFRPLRNFTIFVAACFVLMYGVISFYGPEQDYGSEPQQKTVQQQKPASKPAPAPEPKPEPEPTPEPDPAPPPNPFPPLEQTLPQNGVELPPAEPEPSSPQTYFEFDGYVDTLESLNREAEDLAFEMDFNQPWKYADIERWYAQAEDIADRALRCRDDLDFVDCPSEEARAELQNLFVLVNNKVVNRANALGAYSQQQSPNLDLWDAEDADNQYRNQYDDFSLEYEY